ncbi:hypothetical protein K488DRAFT_55305 [Vararia minispora EC-137]|uniref:Uncharacterized protein n=1 Tax=Vararia minispora EC-137 TaxID=1314806 RepID=A0ACB8QE44_9AGAM|nr:hypothetical protein K488DRAFT_55305 [Vararia minispora EC-137]
MLLYWGTVTPEGPSQLAALRFGHAVHVHSILIFPKDARPLNQLQDVVSETEPESFKLEVYFNAQPTPSQPVEGKQKMSNVLVPTTLSYVGEPAHFEVPMGTQWATRLLILSGKFEKLSLAIYGEPIADHVRALTTYHPKPLPVPESIPLSSALDPATDRDPTRLAQSLLTLIPDAPPLPLIVRLMFSLKPANDDWDLPEFPYIYPNLEEEGVFDLQAAAQVTNRPVSDEISLESLRKFADRVAGSVGAKSTSQAYDAANLLAHAAPQHPDMARLLVDRLDLRSIFDASTVEDDTLTKLLIAASNPDIARALAEAQVADRLRPEHKARLITRHEGWRVLSDALWNTQADFRIARQFLDEIGTDEPSFGVVLHALIQHSDLNARLAENPVLQDTPLVSDNELEIGSHDEFVAYLRAWLGVACVLSVYAWADSLPVVRGRERALGVLTVWQGFKGYREIVNHLMLSRQMLFRLDCMMDPEDPNRSGVLAERILLTLSHVPTSFQSRHLVKTILGLPSGLAVIDDEERLNLRYLAYLTEDGLEGAIQELSHPPERPISPRDLLALRVAVVILAKELRKGEESELTALRTLWEQKGHGLVFHLVDNLAVLSADIATYFSLTLPPPASPEHIGNLFSAANEVIRQLQELMPAYFLPGRALRSLVIATCDLFACADAADIRFSQGSDESLVAQRSRQRCIDLARLLVGSKEGKSFTYAETAFRTLLRHASSPGSRDPANHVTQVFGLIDYLLPMPQEDAMAVDQEELAVNWVTPILPRVVSDLTSFFHVLDPENRTHLLLRVADIDEGIVGVGEWLVMEELKRLKTAAANVTGSPDDNDVITLLRHYEIVASLRVVYRIVTASTTCSTRLVEYIAGEHEPASALSVAFITILAKHLFSPLLVQIAENVLDMWSPSYDAALRFTFALTFLRGTQCKDKTSPSLSPSSLFKNATNAFEGVPIKVVEPEKLCNEIRDTLITLAFSRELPSPSVATLIIGVLDWLVQQSHAGLPQLSTLRGISADTLGALLDRLAGLLDADALKRLDRIRATLTMRGDDIPVAPSTMMPNAVQLSVYELDSALRSRIPPPMTPKRTTPPHAQNILSLVTVSPPTALLRSPAVTGLTKTYSANDFRMLRQTPSSRQNTSRLPSMHVDVRPRSAVSPAESLLTGHSAKDYEMVSPQMLPAGLPAPSQFGQEGVSEM